MIATIFDKNVIQGTCTGILQDKIEVATVYNRYQLSMFMTPLRTILLRLGDRI